MTLTYEREQWVSMGLQTLDERRRYTNVRYRDFVPATRVVTARCIELVSFDANEGSTMVAKSHAR